MGKSWGQTHGGWTFMAGHYVLLLLVDFPCKTALPNYFSIFSWEKSVWANAQRTAHFYLHTDANPTSIEMVVLLTTTIHSTYTLSCGLFLFSQHIKIHLVTFWKKKSQFFFIHFIIPRGKSFLESWVTTLLPDWQPPCIFVWFISKSHEH